MAGAFDRSLQDLPQALRWSEWMGRVEAVLFAAAAPVGREALARVVGPDCVIEDLLEDLAIALAPRAFELARSGGGWILRSKSCHAAAISLALAPSDARRGLTEGEALILTVIAYMQPVTRAEIGRMTGREISREQIARLSRQGLIRRGPRSPEPGSPYSYVTTPEFLLHFGLETLRDLPDLEAMEDAGLLERPAAGQAAERALADLPLLPERD